MFHPLRDMVKYLTLTRSLVCKWLTKVFEQLLLQLLILGTPALLLRGGLHYLSASRVLLGVRGLLHHLVGADDVLQLLSQLISQVHWRLYQGPLCRLTALLHFEVRSVRAGEVGNLVE